jgi:hypothetical protein
MKVCIETLAEENCDLLKLRYFEQQQQQPSPPPPTPTPPCLLKAGYFRGQAVMAQTRCPEASVNYPHTLRNNPEERRHHDAHRGRSLKPTMIMLNMGSMYLTLPPLATILLQPFKAQRLLYAPLSCTLQNPIFCPHSVLIYCVCLLQRLP